MTKMKTELLDDIIFGLDKSARDYDSYEYGLPMDETELAKMRLIVRTWLADNAAEISAFFHG